MKMGLRGGGAGDVCCGVYVHSSLPSFLQPIITAMLILIVV